jgi:hypothetical protein
MTLSEFIKNLQTYEKEYGECIVTTSSGYAEEDMQYSPFTKYIEIKKDRTFVTIHVKKEL